MAVQVNTNVHTEKTFEELADALNVSLTRAMRYIGMECLHGVGLDGMVDYERMTLERELYQKVIARNS
jgi:hypothetical protein